MAGKKDITAPEQIQVQETAQASETKEQEDKARNCLYVCSNGATYNHKEDALEYQKVLNPNKKITEKEIK
jgi:hypothetical protein